MNCQQFDQRVQQQLDERSNLVLDASLQKHARECSQCAMHLSLYDCLNEALSSHAESDSVSDRSLKPALRSHCEETPVSDSRRLSAYSSHRYWKLLGSVLAASLMLMILPMINSPMETQSPAVGFVDQHHSEPKQTPDARSFADRNQQVSSDPYAISFSDIRNINVWEWIPNQMPVTVNLDYVPNINLPTISDISVTSFVPKRPMNAVRMLPSTIETIEPIYRYTSDLPGVKGLSSGINCTLTILWHNMPNLGQSSQQPEPMELDLGLRRYLLTHRCC